jgi:hypothetical protein
MGLFGKKAETKEPKEKKPSEREIMEQQMKEDKSRVIAEVGTLAPGQTLIYQLPEFYWTGFAAFIKAELNPEYPKKVKKFLFFTDGIKDGKPDGRKSRYFEGNDGKGYADAVVERYAKRYI